MYVWSDGTPPYSKRPPADSGRYVSSEYRFEILHDSHWTLDEQPDAVADLLLEWLAAHPFFFFFFFFFFFLDVGSQPSERELLCPSHLDTCMKCTPADRLHRGERMP